jgi:NAD-dependent DNA ligase
MENLMNREGRGNWNRGARRSGGERAAVIHVPPMLDVLVKLCRKMIDEYNAKQDYSLTRAHIQNLAEKFHLTRDAIVKAFIKGLGSSMVDMEISKKIAEIFADDVLKARS